ncbi:hypothetical protein AVEN_177895-1 [Araneus ventricosus]|uniref:Uncharacterized protein n=1 Tax=Araneus ventricosus TaxID=182803 RepID=A0A4Y2CHW3_ARAVE|nr:hypothetical protein AVEN_177895-1 [Araneus ventricosus]
MEWKSGECMKWCSSGVSEKSESVSGKCKVYGSAGNEVRIDSSGNAVGRQTPRLPCDILFGRPSETPSSPIEYDKLRHVEKRTCVCQEMELNWRRNE